MPDAEHAMLVYLKLALVSHRKQQVPGRDRLLVMAATEACHAGLLGIADRCRSIIVASEPHHFLSRHTTFADALRDENFLPLLKQLRRTCPLEQAELLLSNQKIEVASSKLQSELRNASDAEVADWLLQQMEQRTN